MAWTVEKVRQTFIDYFVERDHLFVPSSPVILPNDPTLLFANAGMNQFKPLFLGTADPSSDFAKLKRVVNSQKCIRAGGKHNDLKDVGRDSYHHTFFEMLGSWSFGDYFKAECIKWAWDLLTRVYGLDPERLYATYFGGDEALGLEPDYEARDEWRKYLPDKRILSSGVKDNFWEMGATGPCGPCAEIHYDKVGDGYGLERVNQDDPLVIEIWNLVFIQYVREEEGGSLKPLPAKHIDTGMGLERLSSILAEVPTNYDVDIFQNLIKAIQKITGCKTDYSGKYLKDDTTGIDTAYRTVADHIRTITFAVTDGGIPSNVGSGYVLRRIIRRAVVAGHSKLGGEKGFFAKLVPTVIELMGNVYPTLKSNPENVIKIISEEENQFSRTIRLGLKRFNTLVAGKEAGYVIPGEETAKLYHTFGFPYDLTKRMAQDLGLLVDKVAHKKALEENANVETAAKKKMALLDLHGNAVSDLQSENIAVTDDSFKFLPQPLDAKVVAIWCGRIVGFVDEIDQTFITSTFSNPDPDNPKNFVGIILNKTNFYAEQGGQIFDIGKIGNDKFALDVESVQTWGGYVVHYGTPSGEVKIDDILHLTVDTARRLPITRNHTSTHLVNYSLRTVLGDHINQQGSLVTESKLRFDFAHNKPISHEELSKIDSGVRAYIDDNLAVYAKEVPLAVATKINGVRQMFGEKYPDPVRVVSVGVSVDDLVADPTNEKWKDYSIEFCGGTHSSSSSEILSFVTISEESIAKGTRRIVSVTGEEAQTALRISKDFEEKLRSLDSLTGNSLATASSDLLKELDAHALFPYADKSKFREAIGEAKKKAAGHLKDQEKQFKIALTDVVKDTVTRLTTENRLFRYLVIPAPLGGNCGLIKKAIKDIQKTRPDLPVLIVSSGVEGKLAVVAVSTKDLSKTLPANDWVSKTVAVVNGKSGGKPEEAQAVVSIDAPDRINAVTEAANNFANSVFSS